MHRLKDKYPAAGMVSYGVSGKVSALVVPQILKSTIIKNSSSFDLRSNIGVSSVSSLFSPAHFEKSAALFSRVTEVEVPQTDSSLCTFLHGLVDGL